MYYSARVKNLSTAISKPQRCSDSYTPGLRSRPVKAFAAPEGWQGTTTPAASNRLDGVMAPSAAFFLAIVALLGHRMAHNW